MDNVSNIKLNNETISKPKLIKLSCESIFKYGLIPHQKAITKAKKVIRKNIIVVNEYNTFIDNFMQKLRGNA